MPTYDYRCAKCGKEHSVFQSISAYIKDPIRPWCVHDNQYCLMERKLSVNPQMSGLANALAGDRHYDGMQATDGTDISSRTKHRRYMKERGLTTVDDFKETWKKEAAERELRRVSEYHDMDLRKEITAQVEQAVAKPGD